MRGANALAGGILLAAALATGLLPGGGTGQGHVGLDLTAFGQKYLIFLRPGTLIVYPSGVNPRALLRDSCFMV